MRRRRAKKKRGGQEGKGAGPVQEGCSCAGRLEEDLVLTGVTCKIQSWNKGRNLSQEGLPQQHREELRYLTSSVEMH